MIMIRAAAMAGKITKAKIAIVVMLGSGAVAEIVPVGKQCIDLLNGCALLCLPRIAGLHQFLGGQQAAPGIGHPGRYRPAAFFQGPLGGLSLGFGGFKLGRQAPG